MVYYSRYVDNLCSLGIRLSSYSTLVLWVANMRRRDKIRIVLLIAFVLLLVALDWAALHDIVKGEPNLHAEYGMVVFSVIVFGVLILVGLGRVKGTNIG